MSNLLEKASILTTPTAYNDGKLLSVKPVQTEESYNVDSTDFTVDGTSGNVYYKDTLSLAGTSGVATITFNHTVLQGTRSRVYIRNGADSGYITTYTTSDFSQGQSLPNLTKQGDISVIVTFTDGLTFGFLAENGNEIQIQNFKAVKIIDGDFDFTRNSSATRVASNGLIEDVQILSGNLVQNGDFSQEGAELVTNGDFATDSDWTLGTGWSITEGKAISDGVSSNSNLVTTSSFYSGVKQVKMSISVTDYVSGTLKLYLSTTPFAEITSNGDFTFYTTADRSDGKMYLKSVNFNASIDNVSVKEVGQDWTLGSGWSIGENKAEATNAPFGSQLVDSTTLIASKKYRVSFVISDYVQGNVRVGVGNSFSSDVSSNGNYTFILTASNTNAFKAQTRSGGGTTLSISNISVIEITDDTNLPRIDYDGFSYQDALGSEEVVNGGFENGSANWTLGSSWSVNNGLAYTDGSAQNFITQNVGLITGKRYNLSFDISNRVGTDGCIVIFGGNTFSGNAFANGTQTFQAVANGGIELRIYGFNGNTFNLDNVSVKEYLGQEVVPDSGVGHILLEPQSTNVAIYSGNASQWTVGGNGNPNNTTRVDNQSSPDGETNASLFSRNTGTSGWFGTGNLSTTNGQTYTHSLFVKKGTSSTIIIRNVSNSPQSRVTYNIDTDTFTTENNATGNSLNYGNGWYRIEMTFEYTNATGSFSQIRHTLEDGKSMYVFGAQLEQQSYATSYIPTSGSTITRLGETLNNSGSSDLINSTEGVLYAEIARLSDVGTCQVGLYGNSTTKQVRLEFNNSSIKAQLYNGAYQTLMSSTQVVTNINKIAFKYKVDDFSFWVNGVEVATDTNGSTFNADELIKLNLAGQNGTVNFYGKVKCVAVFEEALTDEELTCLTTI